MSNKSIRNVKRPNNRVRDLQRTMRKCSIIASSVLKKMVPSRHPIQLSNSIEKYVKKTKKNNQTIDLGYYVSYKGKNQFGKSERLIYFKLANVSKFTKKCSISLTGNGCLIQKTKMSQNERSKNYKVFLNSSMKQSYYTRRIKKCDPNYDSDVEIITPSEIVTPLEWNIKKVKKINKKTLKRPRKTLKPSSIEKMKEKINQSDHLLHSLNFSPKEKQSLMKVLGVNKLKN